MSLSGLEPKALWKHFEKILSIPHCSGNEAALGAALMAYAKNKGLEADMDDAGNVVVRIPATPGHENAETIVLQGHQDMVGEKNSDVDFDFFKDPIKVEIQGDWLTAVGTTLGADNGIGLAAGLAVADVEGLVHGPIEVLATVDEEVGLTGAAKLQPGFVKGTTMLNLDSEELGAAYVGCAGGGDTTIKLPVEMVDPPAGTKAYSLKIAGLRGGHSGIDIIEQRGNAIKVAARLLDKAMKTQPCHLVEIKGGSKRNAIPRETFVELMVLETAGQELATFLDEETDRIKIELGGREPDLTVSIAQSDAGHQKVLSETSQKNLIDLLLAIPHGVEAMSYDIEGLVETSNNLATLSMTPREAVIGTSTRSSIKSALQAHRDRIAATARLAGAEVTEDDPYPGWKPDLDSNILKVVKEVHTKVFGKVPEMKAIHAGLECGIIGEKFPGMDMVSFGPWIEHPHSPEERVQIPSVATFWKLLVAVLEELA
jgi:dipeptidase D